MVIFTRKQRVRHLAKWLIYSLCIIRKEKPTGRNKREDAAYTLALTSVKQVKKPQYLALRSLKARCTASEWEEMVLLIVSYVLYPLTLFGSESKERLVMIGSSIEGLQE